MLRRKGIWLRVLFNGVDVSDRCKEADDKTGRVWLYKHNDKGVAYLGADGEVATETLYGHVRFIQVEPWARDR